jgi:hypothetical protein
MIEKAPPRLAVHRAAVRRTGAYLRPRRTEARIVGDVSRRNRVAMRSNVERIFLFALLDLLDRIRNTFRTDSSPLPTTSARDCRRSSRVWVLHRLWSGSQDSSVHARSSRGFAHMTIPIIADRHPSTNRLLKITYAIFMSLNFEKTSVRRIHVRGPFARCSFFFKGKVTKRNVLFIIFSKKIDRSK